MATVTERPQPMLSFCLMAAVVGVIAGLGAWIFRMLIGVIHNLFFLGKYDWSYDTTVHTPAGPFGAWIILAPVIGSLGVTWLVKTFAPEAKGHGVPEVMDAIHYGGGRIRPVVAAIKSIASALSIGNGGSVGREGPIIQIGSAFGSTLGQLLKVPARQRITLIAAGAGGGIAATFNAPLGGVLFAIELLLVSVNVRNLVPVTLATVIATYVGRSLLGAQPAFNFPPLQINDFHLLNPWALLMYLPLGLLLGLAAVLFVRSIYWAEDFFDALPVNAYVRHMLGMLGVGLIIWLLLRFTGYYYVQGVGYATIMDVIRGTLTDPWFLLGLAALKLLVTCLTLGSGGSGGVFSPALFMGATLGAACGIFWNRLMPSFPLDVATAALAGMAAAVGASTGAVLTSIVMLQEMTDDNNVVLPVLLTSVVAAGVRKTISPASIYTLKLVRRGHVVPDSLQASLDDARAVRDVMNHSFATREVGTPPTAPSGPAATATVLPEVTLLTKSGRVQSVELAGARTDFVVVAPETGLEDVLCSMTAAKATCAVVTSSAEAVADSQKLQANSVLGVLSPHDLGKYRLAVAELF